MRRRLLSLFVAAGLAGPIAAQIDSGYYTDGNGYTCRIEVSDTNGVTQPGVDVTLTDAGGSALVTGVSGTGSTVDDPNALSFPSTTTPRGDTEVRGQDGKAQKKNASGEWVDLRKLKKKKARAGMADWGGAHGAQQLQQGQLAPAAGWLVPPNGPERPVYLDIGDAAPFAGMLIPQDEVDSLPSFT